jgi:uncharacterized repeat protein (TIGR03943 family)
MTEARISHVFKTLALAVWSAVLLYFYYTGRLTELLAPVFRPMVLVAGFTLLAITLCYALFARPGARSAELECEHHHEHNAHLPFTSFLVLVLPVCLAVFISPESYSKMVIENRGFANAGAPGLNSQLALWADAPGEEPKPEVYAPDAKFIQPVDPKEEEAATAALATAPQSEPEDVMLNTQDPPLPTADGPAQTADTSTVAQMRNFLNQMEKDPDGYTKLEATDLVYAASQPAFREAMQGLKVALVGQYYPGDQKGAGKLAGAQGPGENAPTMTGGSFFWLVRMSMTCCAADARPTAVKVTRAEGEPAHGDMDWVHARGTADFRETGTGDLSWEAWVKPDKVAGTSAPAEPYLF